MLQKFEFEAGTVVRVETDGSGMTWFNAADVCGALGFVNSRKAVSDHVDADDVQKLDTITDGGRQLTNHVNESGLYALIFGSTKPEAKRFKRWVTSEVLPAIRRTGTYAPPQATPQPTPSLTPMEAARIYCNTFAMARRAGMDGEACHNLACQTKYEASGWWWQFGEAPVGAILASPSKPLQIAG